MLEACKGQIAQRQTGSSSCGSNPTLEPARWGRNPVAPSFHGGLKILFKDFSSLRHDRVVCASSLLQGQLHKLLVVCVRC